MTFLEIRENILDYIDEWRSGSSDWTSIVISNMVFEVTLSHQGYLYLSYYCEQSSSLQNFKKIKFTKIQAAYEADQMNEYLDLVLAKKLKDVENILFRQFFNKVYQAEQKQISNIDWSDISATSLAPFPIRDPIFTLNVAKNRTAKKDADDVYITYEYEFPSLGLSDSKYYVKSSN